MLLNRNNALLSNSNIILFWLKSRSRIDRLKSRSFSASPPGMAHAAIATTSCVALNCVGTQCYTACTRAPTAT